MAGSLGSAFSWLEFFNFNWGSATAGYGTECRAECECFTKFVVVCSLGWCYFDLTPLQHHVMQLMTPFILWFQLTLIMLVVHTHRAWP